MAERRCIVVAPHFPPSGLPPAHRARLFVRHLAACGWTPVVVTIDPRDREEPPEPELLATVPPDVRVELVRALPANVTRVLGVGDLVLRSFRSLASRTIHVARETPDPVVLLVVPPWYALWLAPLVRQRTGAPVVVDYVDPWRIAATGSAKSRVAAWMAERTEGRCLRAVDGLFAVSDAIIADVRTRFPWTSAMPAGAAPYGFEEADRALLLKTHGVAEAAPPGDGRSDPGPAGGAQCRLVYIGALSDAQLPVLAALLDAVVLLRRERPAAAARLRVEFYGTTYAAPAVAVARTTALVAERGLESQVSEHPVRVPYVRALTLADGAAANLVLGDTTAYYAASKLMPVLAAGRPVLAVVHAATEPAALLRRLGGRGLVCYGTADTPSPGSAVRDIASALNELIQGTLPAMTADFTTDAALQSRTAARMTEALAAVLDRVVARRRAVAGPPMVESGTGAGRDRPTA
jgi:glycosyl transferase family 4